MAKRAPYQIEETANGRVYVSQVVHPVTRQRVRVTALTPLELAAKKHELQRLRLDLRDGEDPQVVAGNMTRRLVARKTIEKRVESYINELTRSSKEPAKSAWNRRLKKWFGGSKILSACDREVMAKWANELNELGYAPKSVEDAYWLLHTVMGRAIEDGEIARCPWGTWRPPKGAALFRRECVTTVEELTALCAGAREYDATSRGQRSPADATLTMVVVLVLMGLRNAEAAALSWEDLEIDGWPQIARIRFQALKGWQQRTRSGRPEDPLKERKPMRLQRLHPTVVQVLRLHRELLKSRGLYSPSGPVFPLKKGGYRTAKVLRADVMREIARRSGMRNPERWAVHSTRHSFATLEVLASGGDLVATAQRTGHSDLRTLEGYMHAAGGSTLVESRLPELPPELSESLVAGVELARAAAELPPSVVEDPGDLAPVPPLETATLERARVLEGQRREARRGVRRHTDFDALARRWVAAGEPGEQPPEITVALRLAYTRGYQGARYRDPSADRSLFQRAGRAKRASTLGAWRSALKRARASVPKAPF